MGERKYWLTTDISRLIDECISHAEGSKEINDAYCKAAQGLFAVMIEFEKTVDTITFLTELKQGEW